MTEPRLAAISPAPSQTLFSGAFRSLHCLIYKVLARAAQRRNSCYLITSVPVCQALFSTFFEVLFRTCLPGTRSPDSSAILPNPHHFVNTFLLLFFSFFCFAPFFWKSRKPQAALSANFSDFFRFGKDISRIPWYSISKTSAAITRGCRLHYI